MDFCFNSTTVFISHYTNNIQHHLFETMAGIEANPQNLAKEKVSEVIPYFRAKKVGIPIEISTRRDVF
jgi:hypothetical protein